MDEILFNNRARNTSPAGVTLNELIAHAEEKIKQDLWAGADDCVTGVGYYLFLTRNAYPELRTRRDIMTTNSCNVLGRSSFLGLENLKSTAISHYPGQLSLALPRQAVKRFFERYGGLPLQGYDVLVISPALQKSDTLTTKAFFPAITSLDYLRTYLRLIQRIGLAYLNPKTASEMAESTFIYRPHEN